MATTKQPEKWTIFWLTGRTTVVDATDEQTAMQNAGYGGGAIRAVDFIAKGSYSSMQDFYKQRYAAGETWVKAFITEDNA